jgi:excisionase family DNA binding protein
VLRLGARNFGTPMKQNDTLMTKAEVARDLRVCVKTVEHLMKTRQLAVMRIGRAVRIERAELQRMKKARTEEALA